MFDDFVFWFTGDDGLVLIIRYFLLALVWLLGIIFMYKKRSVPLRFLTWIWGLGSLGISVTSTYVYFASDALGVHGFQDAMYGLFSLIATVVYVLMLVVTVYCTFFKEKPNAR